MILKRKPRDCKSAQPSVSVVATQQGWPSLIWGARCVWAALFVAGWFWRDDLAGAVTNCRGDDPALQLLAFCAVYVALAGLAVPGAVLLTLLAGTLFGTMTGTTVASISSTVGATLAFLFSRHVLLPRRVAAGGAEGRPQAGAPLLKLGASELTLLRLTPIVPFFAVNLLAGRSNLSLRTYWLVSQLAMLPATFLLVHLGSQLPHVESVRSPELVKIFWPVAALSLLGLAARRCWSSKPAVQIIMLTGADWTTAHHADGDDPNSCAI